MADSSLIQSLRAAVAASPEDVPLRLHLAALLLEAGEREEAVRHAAAALERDPASAEARDLVLRATSGTAADPAERDEFDWRGAEAQMGDAVPPRGGRRPRPRAVRCRAGRADACRRGWDG